MSQPEIVSGDRELLRELRKVPDSTIGQLGIRFGVTATAIRQRLNRLVASGFVTRQAHGVGRGRPVHRYRLTDQGRRSGGNNFPDLAVTLWEELRAVRDPAIRRGLLQRIAERMTKAYTGLVEGVSVAERMGSVARLFSERDVPFEAEKDSRGLPVLKAIGCPYTGLAEQDRSVCAMENMMLTELLGARLQLTGCRLDGETCCTFQLSTPTTGASV